ncbi:uncharacterized protein LOC142888406 [Nelusetta ayraudi]|uniref:uncharacterized protein LOC142888406 n=1 Tax=Nelusetta ayraudi TaxID=303726 RepID=UPI003F6EC226
MKLCMFCLFLLVGVVVTAPRVQRDNVLTFLNDALGVTTERTVATASAAARPPQNNPVNEDDSEDLSEEKSTESLPTNGITGVIEDPDSHEEAISKDSVKTPLKKRAENTNDRLVGPVEQMDLNSGEAARDAEPSPGQVDNSSVEQVNQSANVVADDHHRKATPVGGAGFNGMLAAGRSRELQDLDSLEDNAGRPAPVWDHRRDTDYDETRELLSSETYPLAPPQHMSVPVKSQA